MDVPTVTLEDLRAFQAAHFGPSTVYSSSADAIPDTSDPETDDLGYYPDGVKRTITDEEIRIFRHSEIHALLRERERKLQETDSEREDSPTPAGSDEDSEDKVHNTGRISLIPVMDGSTDFGATGIGHQESHNSKSRVSGKATSRANDRKREALDDPKEDTQHPDSGALEYDANPPITSQGSQQAQRAYARKKVSYADD